MSFTCRPGLAASDNVYWRITPTGREDWPYKYECRLPVAIFGQGEVGDPFAERFPGNYVRGVGMTKGVAENKLREDFDKLRESLWAA